MCFFGGQLVGAVLHGNQSAIPGNIGNPDPALGIVHKPSCDIALAALFQSPSAQIVGFCAFYLEIDGNGGNEMGVSGQWTA